MGNRNVMRCAGLLMLAGAVCGCKTMTPGQKQARRIAERLDGTAMALEEYGSVSMSSPLLIPLDDTKTDSPFAFDLTKKADDFFKDAQQTVEGGAARLSETQTTAGLGVRGNLDVTAFGVGQLAEAAQSAVLAAAKQQRDAAIAAVAATQPAERAVQIAAINQTYAQGLAKMAAPTTAPTTAPAAAPTTAPEAKDGALSKSFLGISGLLGGLSPQLRDRIALNIAAGDTATRGMFAVLSDPAKYASVQDKKLLFGVTMVNVEPGWRTKSGFVGEVSVSATYEYRPARREVLFEAYKHPERYATDKEGLQKLIVRSWNDQSTDGASRPFPLVAENNRNQSVYQSVFGMIETLQKNTRAHNGVAEDIFNYVPLAARSDTAGTSVVTPGVAALYDDEIPAELRVEAAHAAPLVAAVSPMTDVQTLDLADSQRQRSEFALQVAAQLKAAGADVAADAFFSYAKQLQTDVRTRSALPVVTAFSNSGGVFGFRVGPQLLGSDTSGGDAGESTNQLERQSFPALVLIAADAADVKLRFRKHFGRMEAVEPVLRLTQSQRWAPLDHHWYSLWPDRYAEPDHMKLASVSQNSELRQPLTTAQKNEKLFDLLKLKASVDDLTLKAGDLSTYANLIALIESDPASDRLEAGSPIDQLHDDLLTHLAVKKNANAPLTPANLEAAKEYVDRQIRGLKRQATVSAFEAGYLKQRVQMLQLQAVGSWNEQYLPLAYFNAEDKPTVAGADSPSITSVLPATVTVDPKTPPVVQFVVVEGKNLDKVTDGAAGLGRVAVLGQSKSLITVQYTPAAAGQADVIELLAGKSLVAAIPVAIAPVTPPAKPVEATISEKDAAGKETQQTFTAPVDHADLIPRLIDARKPASRPAVEVNVNTKP